MRAIKDSSDKIVEVGQLPRAVGIAYNEARKGTSDTCVATPCQTCLPTLAQYIQQAGFYKDETFTLRSPHEDRTPCNQPCGAPCAKP